MFRDADLPLQIIEAPATLVPLRDQFRLLERGARETGDEHFGARLGQAVRIQNLGAYGGWTAAAPDLEGAIVRAGEGLNAMLQTSTALKLECIGGMAHWSITLQDPASEGRHHHELLALSYMLDTVRFFAGQDWSPDLVLTSGTKAGRKGDLEKLYRADVLPGQPVPSIRFDWRLLASRSPNLAARDFAAFLPRWAEPSLPREGDDLAVIAAVTALSLLNGYPRLDWVASKLGLTRRSLQRRLVKGGTSFAELTARILRGRAETLIAEPGLPLTAIAFELGYSDAAHFARAFKKWTGMSPSAYRSINARAK
jgi:AraC-like DNA-binding protein